MFRLNVSNRNNRVYKRKSYGAIAFIFIFMGLSFTGVTIASQKMMQSQTLSPSQVKTDENLTLFKKALTYDLAGEAISARKIYDLLEGTELSQDVEIPSAVNLVALNRFDEALGKFSKLKQSADSNIRTYAHMWQLWIVSKTSQSSPKELRKKIRELSKGFKANVPHQQAVIDIYNEGGDIEKIYSKISQMNSLSENEKRNAFTETTFFIGGYLSYIKKEPLKALELYNERSDYLYSMSLETPLITKAKAEIEQLK